MEFCVLGPVEVRGDVGSVSVGGSRTRAVLTLLVLDANRVVSADRLMHELWPGLTPDRAAANLQVRLSELRRALRSVGEADRLQTRAPRYVLRAAPGELDADRFEQLTARGRALLDGGNADAAVRVLDEALALWRGPALADIDGAQLVGSEQARLEEERLEALESRMDALLAGGRHREAIADLESLTTAHRCASASGISGSLRCTARAARPMRCAPFANCARCWSRSSGSSPDPSSRADPDGRVGATSSVASCRKIRASLGRLILFDKRDTGLSDRAPGDCPLEERIEDMLVVMNAVSSDRAVVFGYSEGAPMSILFTATFPEKVSALILGSAFARWFPAPDDPCGPGAEAVHAAMREIATHRWGQGATIDWFLPSRSHSPQTRQALAARRRRHRPADLASRGLPQRTPAREPPGPHSGHLQRPGPGDPLRDGDPRLSSRPRHPAAHRNPHRRNRPRRSHHRRHPP